MIADTIRNKKLNPVVIELFITDRKLNISIAINKSSDIDFERLMEIYKNVLQKIILF